MEKTNSPRDNPINNLASESLIVAKEQTSEMQKKNDQEEKLLEKEVDLNELFPETKIDLNELFPDEKVKHLLKKIMKNKNDMNSIKERLFNENKNFDQVKE